MTAPPGRRCFYRAGFAYQLEYDFSVLIGIHGHSSVDDFITLEPNGRLLIRKGYAWNGATGILDTRSAIRASLVHDALYQLLRRDKLPRSAKAPADALFRTLGIEDGMWRIKARAGEWLLLRFGDPATRVPRTILSAP